MSTAAAQEGSTTTGLVIEMQRIISESDAGKRASAELSKQKDLLDEAELAKREQAALGKLVDRMNGVVRAWAGKAKPAVLFERSSGVIHQDSHLDASKTFETMLDGGDPVERKPVPLRIAVMDIGRALHTSKAGKAAQAKVKADVMRRQAEIDAELAALKKLSEEAEGLKEGSPEFEANKAEALKRMQNAATLKQFGDHELPYMERIAIEQVVRSLERRLKALAERDGYNLVLDRDGAAVLYAAAKVDVTDTVIQHDDENVELPEGERAKTQVKVTTLRFVDFGRVAQEVGVDLADAKAGEALVQRAVRLVAELAKRDGVDLVLAPDDARPVVYVRPDLDMSAQVIARLKAKGD